MIVLLRLVALPGMFLFLLPAVLAAADVDQPVLQIVGSAPEETLQALRGMADFFSTGDNAEQHAPNFVAFTVKNASPEAFEQQLEGFGRLPELRRLVVFDATGDPSVRRICQRRRVEWEQQDPNHPGEQIAQALLRKMDPQFDLTTTLEEKRIPFEKNDFEGYDRFVLPASNAGALPDEIICPIIPRADHGWALRPTVGQPLSRAEEVLLQEGFFVIRTDAGRWGGSKQAIDTINAAYFRGHKKLGMAKQGILLANQEESLAIFAFAATYPDVGAGILCTDPVCDLGAWLKTLGRSQRHRVLQTYGLAAPSGVELPQGPLDVALGLASLRENGRFGPAVAVVADPGNAKTPPAIHAQPLLALMKSRSSSTLYVESHPPGRQAARDAVDWLVAKANMLTEHQQFARWVAPAPLYSRLDIKQIERNFDNSIYGPKAPSFNGRSVYVQQTLPTHINFWRRQHGLQRSGTELDGPAINIGDVVFEEGGVSLSRGVADLLELTRAMGSLCRTDTERELIGELQRDLAEHLEAPLLTAVTLTYGQGFTLKNPKTDREIQLRDMYSFAPYADLIPEKTRLHLGRLFFNNIRGSFAVFVPCTMDILRDHTRLVPYLINYFPKGVTRQRMIGQIGQLIERVFCQEWVLSSDGAPIHHGIFHYDYANYSLSAGYQLVGEFHRMGYYFSPAVYAKLKRAAVLAADLAGPFEDAEPPPNYGGRAGGKSSIRNFTQWLEAAAALGDGKDPQAIDHAMVAKLAAYRPEHPAVRRFADADVNRGAEHPIPHHTVNRGALSVHSYGDVQAAVGGSSFPFRAYTEMYMLAGLSNYHHAMFAKRGSLFLRSSSPEEESLPLFDGYACGFLPGVTSDARTNLQCLALETIMSMQTGGIGGGTDFADNNTAVWGMEQSLWPSVKFRKSCFFFGDRITCLTSNVVRAERPDRYKEPTRWCVPDTTPIITTLFQWKSGSTTPRLNGVATGPGPHDDAVAAAGGGAVVDRYGNAYVVHPGDENRLHVTRRHQSQVVFQKEFLKTPIIEEKDDPLRRDERIRFTELDKEKLYEQYRPREGLFDLAWIEHERCDGSDLAGCEFTVLVRGGTHGGEALSKQLASAAAPFEVLQRSAAAHVLYDESTKTSAYVIFVGDGALPARGPIRKSSGPAFVMARAVDRETMSVSYVNADPFGYQTPTLVLDGTWRLRDDSRESGISVQTEGNSTVVAIPVPDIETHSSERPGYFPRFWHAADYTPRVFRFVRQ